jgi:hypothetical protein
MGGAPISPIMPASSNPPERMTGRTRFRLCASGAPVSLLGGRIQPVTAGFHLALWAVFRSTKRSLLSLGALSLTDVMVRLHSAALESPRKSGVFAFWSAGRVGQSSGGVGAPVKLQCVSHKGRLVPASNLYVSCGPAELRFEAAAGGVGQTSSHNRRGAAVEDEPRGERRWHGEVAAPSYGGSGLPPLGQGAVTTQVPWA